MSITLGLTHHEKYIQEYLEFMRGKRRDCIRSVESSFESLTEARLMEDNTFTSTEVQEMVSGIWTAIEVDLEAELINSSHMSAILMRQLFQQAERVHMRMQPQIAEIENKVVLEEMAAYERQQASDNKKNISGRKQLEPIAFTGSGESALLQKEIDRLTAENNKLRERIQFLEKKATSFLEEKDKIKSKLQVSSSNTNSSSSKDEEVLALQEAFAALQVQYSVTHQHSSELQEKLSTTNEELLRVSEELKRANEELDKKISQTNQFQTLKKLLESKNEQLKELRTKLKAQDSQ
ncbi:PREDICTED: leucine zipper transcription factor-like protein 1 [Amphimedon queenslandica]|uniref:Leucine zipper transcription factor-like protein 1 n=1 Tax=Amphimedon queenslandica TaxID=400682 RepID=A0A1X7ULA8_AMPQE|nr:PREDICTED: leucine zipper transcription factor-like protein 1 [Amphimedon queenslandica]|eukprot:XP_003387511.1 PREDICTED: leucine zipper transcription factor-like protein 1 [Amphimedon queenslandica]